MFGQQRHPGEGLPTLGARVLLDLGVSLQVGPQVGSVGERPPAVITPEGLLARVRPDVTLKQPRS